MTRKFSLLTKIFFYLIISWLLIHFFAVFGFFAAAVFFVWSILDPQQATCLVCNFNGAKNICKLCNKVFASKLSRGYITALSVFMNSTLILCLTLLSVGAVYLESRALSKLGFSLTNKTASLVIPSHGQYRLNEVFPVKIEIAGVEEPINLVQADLSFDPNILEVTDISTENSFANIFIQKEIDNENGYVRLTGGLPNPGFSSERGEFFTIFFKGKAPGPVKIDFLPTSMVLANDGHGSNVVKDLASVSYLILADEYEESENDQEEVVVEPLVLGTKTENMQMIFYEEKKVLGDKVFEEVKTGQKYKNKVSLWEEIGKIDNFILNLWMSFIN